MQSTLVAFSCYDRRYTKQPFSVHQITSVTNFILKKKRAELSLVIEDGTAKRSALALDPFLESVFDNMTMKALYDVKKKDKQRYAQIETNAIAKLRSLNGVMVRRSIQWDLGPFPTSPGSNVAGLSHPPPLPPRRRSR